MTGSEENCGRGAGFNQVAKFALAFLGLTLVLAFTEPAESIAPALNRLGGNAESKDKPQLPRLLLLGDSIATGYAPPVRKLLEGKADVQNDGGSNTAVALQKLDGWLGGAAWDAIHFNWGLNDLEGYQVPIDQYDKNLRELVKRLKKNRARLIWCSTTPVPRGKVSTPRNYKDVHAYNRVAKKIMEENGIAIDDLYSFALPRLAEIQQKEDVHFTEKGYAVLADQVARQLLTALRLEEPLSIGFRKQLLVDDVVIAERSDVTRELGQLTKANDGKPLLVADKPWEKADLFRLGSVFHDGEKFRMWYQLNDDARGPVIGYAESEDGLRWNKPNLGLQEFQGSKNNNIVNIGDPMSHTCYLDPHETDPAHKYKSAYGPTKPPNGACLAHSPDGFHWTPYNDGRPVTGRAADTVNQLLWEEEAKVYRLYTRTDFGPGGGPDENRGTRDMINPDVKADPTAWKTIRNWNFDREGPQEYKRRQAHHLNGWIHEGIHFGLLCTYEWVGRYKHPGSEVMDFYILTARGDEMWDLSWVYAEKPLISRGPEESFDAVWVQTGPSIFTWKDRHWIYYVGSKDRGDGSREYAIGLATLRLDGLVGLKARDQSGTIETKSFHLEGSKLEVNLDANNGEARLEILDAAGQPIPGFAQGEARTFKRVNELRLEPKWKDPADIAALKGMVVRLKFHLKNARLYAFQVKS